MENDNVVSSLIRRRQEIADALDKAQAQVHQLVLEIDAVDVTIRLFRPELDVGSVRVKPVPRRHAANRYEASRLIFSVLREAQGPMTTRELAKAIMEARGMNTADLAMLATMKLRLATTLRKLRNRGKLMAEREGGRNMRWTLMS